jgi:stage II sporulation protein D
MRGRREAREGVRVACALLALLLGSAAFAYGEIVRVLLHEAREVTVAFDAEHRGSVDGTPFAVALPLAWPLRAEGGSLWLDDVAIGATIEFTTDDGVAFDGRAYRGALRLIASDDRLLVVNVLGIEEYLRGVVPAEMAASWPLEALKAQAVAARTFTLRQLAPSRTYDLCATTSCQVYRGRALEHPATDAAVAATAGEVLTYDGDLARAYYHAHSGGVVASAAEVWGNPLPYLPRIQDVVAAGGPYGEWTARLDPQRMAARLATIGVRVGTPTAVRILATSDSGRVLRAEVVGDGGRAELAGAALTAQLRAWGLLSTRVVMTGPLTVRGSGWGHGVGMSQYGARDLALRGSDYRAILAFYYPRTDVRSDLIVAAR